MSTRKCSAGSLLLQKKNVMKKWPIFDSLTQRINDAIILLMQAAGVVIVFIGILYLIKTGWALYQFTAVGEHYLNRYGPPRLMLFLDSTNIIVLIIKTTLISLGISLATAVLSRFLGLSSQLYVNKRLPVRILLWGLPITWFTALTLQQNGVEQTLLNTFFLTLLPCIGLLNPTFRFVHDIIPELELLLTGYPPLAQLWEGLSRCLSLIFVSTVISVMALYFFLGLYESGLNAPAMGLFHIESPSWGRIPLDLTPLGMLEVAAMLSLTVFFICAVPSIFGQLLHAIRSFYMPLTGPVKLLVFGPVFVFFSALGIRCFNHVEPLGGAIVLAIVPTFSIYPALLNQLPDIVPEMGELVRRLDPRVKGPVDLPGVFKWLGRKLNLI
jgi:hypothetical protein